jgi:hypothetical protein
MKLSIEVYEDNHTIETNTDDLTVSETVEYMYRLCISSGYDAGSVAEAFLEIGELYCPSDEKEDTYSGVDITWHESGIEPYDGLLRDDTLEGSKTEQPSQKWELYRS